MAITPRIFVEHPAALAVAAIAVFGFSITTTYWGGVLSGNEAGAGGLGDDALQCQNVLALHGEDLFAWEEGAWIDYASCFEAQNKSERVIEVARQGLYVYPRSEVLWNLVGYHKVRLGDHRGAVETLRLALRNLEPTSPIMENNLAWAGLFSGTLPMPEMRILYASALERAPMHCESLHTGLTVEYAIAQRSSTAFERAEALKRFQLLRERYDVCESRAQKGDDEAFIEVASAAVLSERVDLQMGNTPSDETLRDLAAVGRAWQANHPDLSAANICARSIPGDLGVPCAAILSTRARP